MMRSVIFAPLVLSAAAVANRDFLDQGSPLDPKTADPAEVTYAMQDMQDAMSIKGQFKSFLDRVDADTEKLHAALENQQGKISDLELEKQSLQSQMQTEKARLTHELEVFKQKMIAKITDLKTTNRRLEETNMQLVSSNDKLNTELEAEKGKKELLVKKLKKMATMFDKQQQSVQNIIQQNSQRIESEVNSDVSDALYAANDPQNEAVAAPTYNVPARNPVVSATSEEEDDALKLPAGLEDEEDEVQPKAAPKPAYVPQPQAPQRVAAPQPKAAPHQGEIKKAVNAAASAAAAHARKVVEEAAKKAKATADAKVQAEALKPKPAPPVATPAAPKAAAPVTPAAPAMKAADDDQLKALRAEVEKLESSVKNDDSEGASAASSASMLHVAKKTAKVAAQDKNLQDAASDSVKTLQDVGGMLSAAMSAADDDN